MDIRHLRLIVAVAANGSLTKAAGELYLSQSALSHQLKGLEDELKIKIFERKNNQMILTPIGVKVKESARKALRNIEELKVLSKQRDTEVSETIRFSMMGYTTFHWLWSIIKKMNSLFPNTTIKIISENSSKPHQLLESKKLDFSLMIFNPLDIDFVSIPLFIDELVLVTSTNHPLAGKAVVEIEDLNHETIITHAKESERDIILERAADSNQFKAGKFIQIDYTESIIQMVEDDFGISILSKWAIRPYLTNKMIKISKISISGLHRKWYLVHRDEDLTQTQTHFIHLIKDALNDQKVKSIITSERSVFVD